MKNETTDWRSSSHRQTQHSRIVALQSLEQPSAEEVPHSNHGVGASGEQSERFGVAKKRCNGTRVSLQISQRLPRLGGPKNGLAVSPPAAQEARVTILLLMVQKHVGQLGMGTNNDNTRHGGLVPSEHGDLTALTAVPGAERVVEGGREEVGRRPV